MAALEGAREWICVPSMEFQFDSSMPTVLPRSIFTGNPAHAHISGVASRLRELIQ